MFCAHFVLFIILKFGGWKKGGGSKLNFLSCGLQELAVLVQLGGHGHVTELVTDGHHHTTNNSRVNLNKKKEMLYVKIEKYVVTLTKIW